MTKDTEYIQGQHAASRFLSLLVKVKRPIPREPDQYESLQTALYYLRKISGLTIEEVAFRIGMSSSHLSNVEAANVTNGMAIEYLESVKDLAVECCLPRMAEYIKLVIAHQKNAPGVPRHRPGRMTLKDKEQRTRHAGR